MEKDILGIITEYAVNEGMDKILIKDAEYNKGEGSDLVQYVDISLFSEPDEKNRVGTASFVYNGYEWNVPFWYMGNNYYSGGSIDVPGVDFAVSTIPGFDGEPGNYYIRILINAENAGQLKREYQFVS